MSKNIADVIDLCVVFKEKAEAAVQAKPELQQKAVEVVTPYMGDLQSAMAEISTMALGGMLSDPSKLREDKEFQDLNLKVLDIVALIVTQLLSEQEVAATVPDELKNQETADLLRSRGAENMAKLCKA